MELVDSIDGRLPAQKQVLYEVPPCLNFFIKSVILINLDDGVQVDAELWVDRGAGSRRIIPKYSINAGKDAQELTFIPLVAGDKIEGKASAADAVDYLIGIFIQQED